MHPDVTIPAGLPAADSESLARSESMCQYICERIRAANGALSFGEFMQCALYAPELGYYTGGAQKFGSGGDFVTAPEISPLFGAILARQCAERFRRDSSAELLELGAGSGALAVAVLRRLLSLDALPARYCILEVSSELAARQEAAITSAVPELRDRVVWVAAVPEHFRGVVIANEVADALPVERFERTSGGVRQLFVVESAGDLHGRWVDATAPVTANVETIERELGQRLPSGYRSEVSLGLPGWIGDLMDRIDDGLLLLFDYGLPRHEYYAPSRDRGWLRCHFRHHAHDEALIYPGIQDITSWVDFSAAADAGHACGAVAAGFVTQAMFLLNGGLDNEFAAFASLDSTERAELTRQVKLLTLPGEMGERFKCLGLTKGEAPLPDAFAFGDRIHTL